MSAVEWMAVGACLLLIYGLVIGAMYLTLEPGDRRQSREEWKP